ncbi:hypothetical protein OG689_07465 [Kitasatospora sp. NBC_00240]|uniref:hypothetical protein n=1 Tax=Kitasatospora sp. NBC_00240 TaxID=2903567 RepID=UPI0022577395|nr:hypothetical protein [Kitasatospora sp. NBC_00240]MCX5209124.1 hypothetical protein [Kitasatospora sp. NBC_00240]
MTCAVLAAGLLPEAGFAVADQPTGSAATAQKGNGQLFAQPDDQLGRSWRKATDVSVIGSGDTAGFHILRADESSAFSYKEVAVLKEDILGDIGLWTGYVCTTGTGRYAAAVYAPSLAANKPAMMQKDAFAAVVDLATGKVTKAITGVELAYFSPGCGSTDTVVFTRSDVGDDGRGDTQVYDVAAATGKVLRTSTVRGQFTNPLPTSDGKDLGVLNGQLVELSADGQATALAALPGRLFALVPSKDSAVDLAMVVDGKDAVHRWTGKSLTELGTAPLGSVGLFPQADGDLIAGDVKDIDVSGAPGLGKAEVSVKPVAASRFGHLLTTSVVSEQLKGVVSKVGPMTDVDGAGHIQVSALATASGSSGSAEVVTAAATAASSEAADEERLIDGNKESDVLAGVGVAVEEPSSNSHFSNCLVKRNDVHAQALQPSTNMVEWAVDNAVHGNLTVSRPDNFLATGEPAHTPQGLFPAVPLSGGGTIPAQVMLGIVAQESNLKQASWHAVPGDAGNPTLGDYFGNGGSIHAYPQYGAGDCGYGIAQVTAGMSETGYEIFSAPEAYAIATDYAANIAAGAQILSRTWNQLKSLGMNVNSGSANHIENWSMALWGYNSGVYTDQAANGGHTGVGWFNNPANPHYPANRQPFLRATYDDAAHPANWPYQEKVMGWAETPQLTYSATPSYSKPNFPITPIPSPLLNLSTNYTLYCNSSNACTPNQTPDACPAENSSCWWHGSVSWFTDTDSSASTENLKYALGSAEPPLQRKYPQPPCNSVPGTLGTILIDDLPNPNDNVFGCNESRVPPKGKFNLRFGDNFTHTRSDGTWRATEDLAPIDLHQIGGGYDGHFWFTHGYSNASNNLFHKVTATWTPDPQYLPASSQAGQRFDIYVHLPDHGAQGIVGYKVQPGTNSAGKGARSCRVNQGTKSGGANKWVELGTLQLWAGGNVQADNTSEPNYTGNEDLAFDAIAFVPAASASTTAPCWTD